MRFFTRLFLWSMLSATVFIFIYSGIDQFPDYNNYMLMTDDFSNSDYKFEWFSRYILGLEGVDSESRVATLAFFNQLVCFVFFSWLGFKSRLSCLYGGLFLFSLLGFMFMTTTLRASSAYLCIAAFFLRSAKFDLTGIFLLFFSVAWHDSAAVVVSICFASRFVELLFSRVRNRALLFSFFSLLVIFLSGSIVLLSDFLRPFFINFVNFDLGARADYIYSTGARSFSKDAFVVIVMFVSYQFIRDTSQEFYSRVFAVFMIFIFSVFYVLSSIMAVRFSFFILCVLFPLRGVVLFEWERLLCWRVVLLVFSPLVFYMSTIYIFSNSF